MPIVETSSGFLRGRDRGRSIMFAGVPYAEAPTGRRRFRPPAAHPGWSGVRDAVEFGAASVQASFGHLERKEVFDEDCLFLNIETPAIDRGKRPVLVWIHGGGFISGAGSFGEYRGSRLVADGDLVFVSLNYRLGALGWSHLAHRFADFQESHRCGFDDQLAALRWVFDNIGAFGGDPSRITVGGQSAGAMSIARMLEMSAGVPHFDAAVLQSGTAEHFVPTELAVQVADELLDELGVRSVDDLMAVPAAAIVEAQTIVLFRHGNRPLAPESNLTFGPVGEPRDEATASRERAAAGSTSEARRPIPILLGSNLDDCQTVAEQSVPSVGQVLERLEGQVDDPHRLYEYYEHSTGSPIAAWSALMSDVVYRFPALRAAERWADSGGVAYRYLFSWRPPGSHSRAIHSREIPFVFGTADTGNVVSEVLAGPNPPDDLQAEMPARWISFVHTHDPSPDGLTAWPPYHSCRSTMVLDSPVRLVEDPEAGLRPYWGRFV